MRGGAFDLAWLREQMRVSGRRDAALRVGRATERVCQELRLALLERGKVGFRKQRADIGIGEHFLVKAVDDRRDVGFAAHLSEQRIGTANRRQL